jgi:hypothetical protein
MSLLDTASLIVTPNGYKEGKLYSVIPSDGSGDMSVVRATTATRVNSAGLVELVPYNLLTYSEALTPNYTFNQCSITSNQTDPNGTSNAKRITNGATATDVYFEQSIGITNSVYTWSVYVKKGTDTAATIKPVHVGIGGDVSLMTFTFATETIATSGAITTSGFTSLGNGWYRIYCSVPITSAVVSLRGRFGNTNTPNVYNDWFGAQLVEGSTAKDYQKTETRLNIPRLDYSNGTCPSLLVEPQRTNLLTYSSSFDNSDWGKIGITAFANNTTAPNGTMSADKIAFTNTNSYIYPTAVVFAITNNSFSYSVYAKADTQSAFNMLIGTPVGVWGANFDLTTQTATPFSGSGTSGKIESVDNGWFRCILTAPIPVVVYAEASIGFPIAGGSLFFWGAQIEAGAYPTSYIPTTSASVTRNADVISKTGISSLIGQTEGTLFLDVTAQLNNADEQDLSISDGTGNNRAIIRLTSSGVIRGIGVFGGSLEFNIGGSAYTTGTRYKIALAYKNNDVALYVNGTLQGSTSTTTISGTLSRLGFDVFTNGAQIICSPTQAAALWKTRLTNAQLTALTTL